jgi:hypothetical protein
VPDFVKEVWKKILKEILTKMSGLLTKIPFTSSTGPKTIFLPTCYIWNEVSRTRRIQPDALEVPQTIIESSIVKRSLLCVFFAFFHISKPFAGFERVR